MAYSISVEGTTVVAETYNECVKLWELVNRKETKSENEWVFWNGGNCPVTEDTIVDVRFRNGEVELSQHAGGLNACWENDEMGEDIIAYRVVKDDEDAQ